VSEVLIDPSHLTAGWLTTILQQRGILGVVSETRERDRRAGEFSIRIHHYTEYSTASESAPKRLFLKLSVPECEPSRQLMAAEVRFYLG
jgi:hypothetical protein